MNSTPPTPMRVPEARVDCGACRACCHQAVVLADEEVGYEVETIATAQGPFRFLQRRPDGSCVYLTPAGCGIHANRPAVCRRFDCGVWYPTVPRSMRKYIARHGDQQDRRMLREGRRRPRQ